ncbi:MAG: IS1634 family transposase, partial [Actinomycetota bacterium]
MYIDVVPNCNPPPAVLLREGWREGKKTKKRTLANLSMLPPEAVDALRRALRGEVLVPAGEAFEILSARPHGHGAAVLGTLRRIGLESMLASRGSRARNLAVAMICARILEPGSKLATARGLDAKTATSTLGEELGLEAASADELYAALDWLLERQKRIEAKLAKTHLQDGTLLLYDVTSTYFEGRTCPLAAYGHNRDGKKGKLQIVFGLLCTAEGCPVAVEVFPGNTSDPKTLSSAIEKVRVGFGLRRVIMVADRGLLTEARIEAELRPTERIGWITALRAPAIQELVESGPLQLSLFDEQDLAEITAAAYPGERL